MPFNVTNILVDSSLSTCTHLYDIDFSLYVVCMRKHALWSYHQLLQTVFDENYSTIYWWFCHSYKEKTHNEKTFSFAYNSINRENETLEPTIHIPFKYIQC